MSDLVECRLFIKHSASFDKIIEINNTGLTLKDLQTYLGSETAIIEDSESCCECARVTLVRAGVLNPPGIGFGISVLFPTFFFFSILT